MHTISRKLTLAFLLVAVTAAVLVTISIRLTSPQRLDTLLRDQARSQLETLMVNYYTANGSFDRVASVLESSGFLPPPLNPNTPGHSAGPDPNSLQNSRLVFVLADKHGQVIVSLLPDIHLGDTLSSSMSATGTSLRVNGAVVGTILTPPEPFRLTPVEQTYLNRTNQALWLAALGAVLVALVMGIFLARSFARPLRALTSAAHRMAEGELDQEVRVSSRDEIGQLTQAFNSMSTAVSKANALRRQMTADIAHDLRTPLTVIAGYVESMRDKVLKPTPERLDLIHSEIERLQVMVEDLRTLSRADAGELTLNRQRVSPRTLLEHVAAVYHHQAEQKRIALITDLPDELPEVLVDETRLAQVLGNIINNALRFTPEGGTILLGASRVEGSVQLYVQDTGSGIQPKDLPYIFERFYRADKSRTNTEGASGLGLAIARALVTAHGGTISAESVLGQGTKMTIVLPVGGASKDV